MNRTSCPASVFFYLYSTSYVLRFLDDARPLAERHLTLPTNYTIVDDARPLAERHPPLSLSTLPLYDRRTASQVAAARDDRTTTRFSTSTSDENNTTTIFLTFFSTIRLFSASLLTDPLVSIQTLLRTTASLHFFLYVAVNY